MIHIRTVKVDNIQQLAEIEAATDYPFWTESEFLEQIKHGNTILIGAFDDQQVIAYLLARIILDELHIVNIVTSPDYRRQGVARSLLQHVCRQVKNDKVCRVLLEARVSNLAAINLYKSEGFIEVGRRVAYYANGEDALLFDAALTI